jgi:hypothetical protein
MLIEHGAFVGLSGDETPSLGFLLCNNPYQSPRLMKFFITRFLVEHTKEDPATASFLYATFEYAMQRNNNDACQILLEAGMDPQTCLYGASSTQNLSFCQLLVRDYQIDPFLQQQGVVVYL